MWSKRCDQPHGEAGSSQSTPYASITGLRLDARLDEIHFEKPQ
jgi:hypothetical protein